MFAIRQGRSFWLIMVGLGVLVAGVLACSAGSQATSSGGDAVTAEAPTSESSGPLPIDNLDACSVVTQEDASGIFGVPADPGIPGTGFQIVMCRYANADKTMGLSVLVEYDEKGGQNSSDYVSAKDAQSQDVPGLGDAAYFNSLHHLTVAKGNWFIVVNGLIAGEPVPLDTLKPLAQTALGRLP